MESIVADLLAKCYYHKQKRHTARVTPPPMSYEQTPSVEEAR
ncbi:MAG TPA: hypothetical protein VGH90_08335 [Chthoniobacteraceae bacterium]